MNTRVVTVLVTIIVLAGGALWVKHTVDGMRPKGSDVEQIRQMLVDGEAAAERRDPAGINKFISNDYQDGLGLSDSSMRYQISRYLREHNQVNLNIPSQSVQVQVDQGEKTASVSFQVDMLVGGGNSGGSGSGGSGSMALTLKLRKEPVRYLALFPGEEWRVISAEGYSGAPD